MKNLLKKRFEILEKENKRRLKNLSPRKALKLEEELLSSHFILTLRKNFSEDVPVCLKNILKRKA